MHSHWRYLIANASLLIRTTPSEGSARSALQRSGATHKTLLGRDAKIAIVVHAPADSLN